MKTTKAKQVHSLTIYFLRAAAEALESGKTKKALSHMGTAIAYLNIKAK